jgi:hypothetical protein
MNIERIFKLGGIETDYHFDRVLSKMFVGEPKNKNCHCEVRSNRESCIAVMHNGDCFVPRNDKQDKVKFKIKLLQPVIFQLTI